MNEKDDGLEWGGPWKQWIDQFPCGWSEMMLKKAESMKMDVAGRECERGDAIVENGEVGESDFFFLW